jgi:putative ABC transport system permease protein
MTTFIQDLRYGARMLARSPGFAAVAMLTIALGVGANTAIFSVVNAVLIRPLPYPRAQELVMVWQDMRARGGPEKEWATPGNVADWKSSGLFAGLAAVQGWQPSLTGHGDAEALPGEMVTADYFTVLGISPALGRGFRAEDDQPASPRVVMLGDGLWQRRFGGDRAIVGRSIVLSGEPHEIVGVLPAGFRPAIRGDAEIWRPRRLNLSNPSRGAVILRVVARLKPDVSIAEAGAAAAGLAAQLAAAHPDSNAGTTIGLSSLHEEAVGDIERGLWVLVGAVAFVLLIACANVANLLLARATSRTREVAVRLALGAGRGRLVRQFLTESLLLAAAGGAIGILFASWGIDALLAIAPRTARPAGAIALDARVLWFAVALTAATGMLFGLVPALQASGGSVAPALKASTAGGHGSSSAGSTTRRALIVVEVATALVLLVGSGLLLRTLTRLQAFDLGFEPARVLVGQVNPPRVAYGTREQLVGLYDRLVERAAAIPGVETAALSSVLPLTGDSDMTIFPEGRPLPRTEAEAIAVWYRIVSSEYFRAVGIRITAGRSFEPREAAPAIVVSDVTARRLWNGENPLGRRVRFSEAADAPWFTVVGVAREVHVRGARGESRSEVYLPYSQFAEAEVNIVLKTSGRPELLAGSLRQAVRDVDPDLPVSGVDTMAAIVARSIDEPRFFAALVSIFAGLALGLAALGIYGVIAFAVAERTAEIGVRMALGAGRLDVLALVAADGLKLTLAGAAAGGLAAAALGLSLESMLFGVTPLDPATFAITTGVLLATAVCASVVPARRAARVDPMAALRVE